MVACRLALPLLFIALLPCTACSTGPIDTRRDANVDVSKYKTYQWVTDRDAHNLGLLNPAQVDYMTGFSKVVLNPQIEPELKNAVNHEMRAKGFVETTQLPDFYVTYYGKAKDQDWVSTWAGSVPSVDNVPLIMYPGYERRYAREYRDGDLLLVFYDARSKSPAWTGIMLRALDQKKVNLGTVTADLNSLVSMFKSSG